MSTTEQRKAANRINALKSTGPKSGNGKAISSTGSDSPVIMVAIVEDLFIGNKDGDGQLPDDGHPYHGQGMRGQGSFWSSRAFLVFLAFAAMALVLLWSEHRAHILGALPYLFILACPLTMAGGWALKLQAKVPGETETVEGSVVFKAKD
jgi:hypothetical protein